jgi:serine/threonine protein kinase
MTRRADAPNPVLTQRMKQAKAYLQCIIRSGLLNREQLVVSMRALPRTLWSEPETIAQHLIDRGELTRYQADKLLRGSYRGLVLGPFRILEPIGKGGISIVYLAADSRSGEQVAIKTFQPKSTALDARALARFQREMELSRRLDHSHIAYTYEVGCSNGTHYLAMEYVQGKSLGRLVADEGPLTLARTARLFVEVASALEHAHSCGLIHRDLKPSNIMVSADDHAKVLDFGLALVKGELELVEVIGGKGYAVGTVDYMPPEQAQDSSKVDERSDLYSLGCSMYYALTGRPPFPVGTKIEKLRKHLKARPEPLLQLREDLHPDFAAIVAKLMAKRPAGRYASARAVERKLLPWIDYEE